MTRSFNQLIYEIIELYRANYKVTDSIDERLVATWIQHTRAKLLKQRFDENMRSIDEHNVQDLGAVLLERVDSSSVNGLTSDRNILRTSRDIPTTIDRKGCIGTFTRLSTGDRLVNNINLVSYERALRSGNGKFNSNDLYAYLDGKKICVISKSGLHLGLNYIQVKGVFTNPIEAYEFATGNTYDWDYEYPISESIVDDMKNMIVRDNFKFIMTPLQDPANNASDDLTNIPAK